MSTPFHLLAPIFTPIPLTYRMFGLNNPTQFEMLTEIFRGLGYRNAPARARLRGAGRGLDLLAEPGARASGGTRSSTSSSCPRRWA